MKKVNKVFENIKTFIKTNINPLLITALILIPLIFGIYKMPAEMAISAGTISMSLFFCNINKFEQFTAWGWSAKVRAAVDKAYAAIEEVKELSLALTAPIVDEMAASGRLTIYIPLKYKLERVKRVKKLLKKLGASESEIADACNTLCARVRSDHANRIISKLRADNPQNSEPFKGINENNLGDWSKDRIEKLITENNLVRNSETDELLLDLDYFTSTEMLRRPEGWQG